MRTPSMRSFGFCTPPFPQSLRFALPSDEMKRRLPMIVGSPCEVMHETTETICGFAGSLTFQTVNPAKFPWYTYLPPNAMSELMNVSPRVVSNCAGFLENE